MIKRDIPDFLIVGAQKCGTTSLFYWLREHPSCYMPKIKEPHFFSNFIPNDKIAKPEYVIRESNAYEELFIAARDDQLCGEASPSYLFDPLSAAKIYDKNPKCKCIIILRDPVERAYSQYKMSVVAGWEARSFKQVVENSITKTSTNWSEQNDIYIELSRYYTQVVRYYEVFPEDQILIISSEALSEKTKEVLEIISQFLGIDPSWWGEFEFKRHFEGRIPRNNTFKRLLGSSVARAVGRLLVPKRARPFIASRILSGKSTKSAIDPEVSKEIWKKIEPEMIKLERLVGRSLPDLWKTYPNKRKIGL